MYINVKEALLLSFGKRLKEARLNKNLTQTQLADLLGVRNTTIANYETEVSSPKEDILLKIFDILEVSPNFLYQDSFSETKEQDFICTPKEKAIIKAYRNHPEMQEAVDRLLGLDKYAEEYSGEIAYGKKAQ